MGKLRDPPLPVGTTFAYRSALNLSSATLGPLDWTATTPTPSPDPLWVGDYASEATIPVVSPAAQVGWGFVDNSTADEMVRRILEQDFSIPAEKQPHVASIEAAYRAREEYWRARLDS